MAKANSRSDYYRRNVNARRRANAKAEHFTIAGPVTVTRTDGTTEIRPAYSEDELRKIVGLGPNGGSRARASYGRPAGAPGHRNRRDGQG